MSKVAGHLANAFRNVAGEEVVAQIKVTDAIEGAPEAGWDRS